MTASKSTDRARLDAIRARLDATTPGPWPVDLLGIVERNGSRGTIRSSIDIRDDDLRFLAAAQADIAYLLERVETLEHAATKTPARRARDGRGPRNIRYGD